MGNQKGGPEGPKSPQRGRPDGLFFFVAEQIETVVGAPSRVPSLFRNLSLTASLPTRVDGVAPNFRKPFPRQFFAHERYQPIGTAGSKHRAPVSSSYLPAWIPASEKVSAVQGDGPFVRQRSDQWKREAAVPTSAGSGMRYRARPSLRVALLSPCSGIRFGCPDSLCFWLCAKRVWPLGQRYQRMSALHPKAEIGRT